MRRNSLPEIVKKNMASDRPAHLVLLDISMGHKELPHHHSQVMDDLREPASEVKSCTSPSKELGFPLQLHFSTLSRLLRDRNFIRIFSQEPSKQSCQDDEEHQKRVFQVWR